MKKYVVAVVFIAFIIWGIYESGGNPQQNPNTKPSSGTVSNFDQVQPMRIGLEKGDLAPDFELQTLDGKIYKLSDLRGKKVIINFWATWCPPCRLEMPDMEKFYEQYKNNGVEILAVNQIEAEKNKKDVPQFIEEFKVTFPILLDEKANISRLYSIVSIPTSLIVDSQGIIRERMTGPMTYNWMKKTLNSIR